MNRYEGAAVRPSGEGRFEYPFFAAYWAEPNRFPLWLMSGEARVGFCLLADNSLRWAICEFYIKPEYRRQGLGTAAVEQVKAYCRAAGRYDEIELWALDGNTGAVAFWEACGFALTGRLGTAQRRISRTG